MDVSREALLDELNDFEKKRPSEITPVLEDYLLKIAKCGDTMFPWSKFKLLIRKKLEVVMSDFHEGCPTDNLPPVPNVELFKFDSMKCKILEAVDSFQSTPFTIQRLCELLTSPKKHYKRTDKFMRGIEKNILVVSTVEPRHLELINNNGSLVVNGVLEVCTDGDMLISSQKDMDSDNNLNNNNNNHSMFIQHERVAVNGVPLPEGLFTTDPSSSNCSNLTTSLGPVPEMESSSEDSSDSSTDSSADYASKESPLETMVAVGSSRGLLVPGEDCTVVMAGTNPLETLPGDKKEAANLAVAVVGAMEDADDLVQEEARQLLSQVAANIEEHSLLIDPSEDSAKFPVTGVIMDTSLELSFNLGKDLTVSEECLPASTAEAEARSPELRINAQLENPPASPPLAAAVGCNSVVSTQLFPEGVEPVVETISMLISDPVKMEEAEPSTLAQPGPSSENELPGLLDPLTSDTSARLPSEVPPERMETESCLAEQNSQSVSEPSEQDGNPARVPTLDEIPAPLAQGPASEEPVAQIFEAGMTEAARETPCAAMEESQQGLPSLPEQQVQASEEPMDQD